MTAQTLTLDAFLLARIAEDERREVHSADCSLYGGDYAEDCTCTYPARVLAECEAKRRIVEMCGWAVRSQDWVGDHETYAAGQQAWDTLELLASAYRDHPDYDPAWA